MRLEEREMQRIIYGARRRCLDDIQKWVEEKLHRNVEFEIERIPPASDWDDRIVICADISDEEYQALDDSSWEIFESTYCKSGVCIFGRSEGVSKCTKCLSRD